MGTSTMGTSTMGRSTMGTSRMGTSRMGTSRMGTSRMGRSTMGRSKFVRKSVNPTLIWKSSLTGIAGLVFATFLMGSRSLALPFMVLGSTFPYLLAKRKREKELAQLATLWPELLDHMISGLRSGLSIAKTIIG